MVTRVSQNNPAMKNKITTLILCFLLFVADLVCFQESMRLRDISSNDRFMVSLTVELLMAVVLFGSAGITLLSIYRVSRRSRPLYLRPLRRLFATVWF